MDETALQRSIATSKLPFPKGLRNRSKYVFWKAIYPIHGTSRDILLSLGILHHEGRQNYLLGHIASGRSIEDFVRHLAKQGYLNHFVALKDDDEVVSVRRLVDFEHQYHLRIFKDGEVRGHYEFTPESHPKWHMEKIGQEPHREEFLKVAEGWIVPVSEETLVQSQAKKDVPPSVTRILGRKPF